MAKVENLLDMYPRRMVRYTYRDGKMVLILPKKGLIERFYIKVFHFTPYYRIKLDDYGTYVVSLCNGKFTVREIGERLKKRFGPEVEPLYERLARFLYQLEDAGVIEISPEKKE